MRTRAVPFAPAITLQSPRISRSVPALLCDASRTWLPPVCAAVCASGALQRRGLQHAAWSQRRGAGIPFFRRSPSEVRGRVEPSKEAHWELSVRLDALKLMQEMRLPKLQPSSFVQGLTDAAAGCAEFQTEDMEGHCAPEQLEFLRSFVAHRFGSPQFAGGLKICQIGFNAGHSAAALLDQAPEDSVLLSLDLCRHAYTRPLEKFVAKFRHIEFDLMFIDGNHAYEAVKLDMLLCLQMALPTDTRQYLLPIA
ncbi:hypothetical protein AK812_SmicGene40483 [Symbiodinium microadriaticum]|uniref:Uncharacterized protein n=1 Tax=Symbiodinium microadriaticum TaxID=2951 RepID=A0A1Q9C8K9_SYMMI|nr:hypothetical protein AK812_SmicGene40483 [Symbiodinium microadriaticum]